MCIAWDCKCVDVYFSTGWSRIGWRNLQQPPPSDRQWLLHFCVFIIHHMILMQLCLSVSGRGRRVGVFVSIGGTGILFHLLVTASKETVPSEELMMQLHLLLAKVGPKGTTVSSHSLLLSFSGFWRSLPLFLFACKCLGTNVIVSLRAHACFNLCLSRQKVWREGSTERSSHRHCQLNQAKPT